ncbi:3-oxoacyl-ACP reductase [Priestia megaterium]|nr:3-oxoacyl-ACP reductase [Priestia megaterium]
MRLAEKVAIITGAGSGLGKEAALLFAKEGAIVIVADFNENASFEVADSINQNGGEALAVTVNVANHDSVKQLVETVVNRYGKIDILINNAGITADSTLLKMTDEQWHNVINVNLTGVYYCTREAAPHMVANGSGKIVNTSSIVGRMGNFGQTNYAAAKGALLSMTQTWAKELGRKGVNVNAVAPGFIETEMTKKMPENVLQGMKEKVAVQRLGSPRDVANMYLFLSSSESDYVNGAVLPVDGGLSI